MDYKEKYIKALEWMQSLYSGLHGATKEEAEKYFPELKESEDEKVKRIIYSIVTKMSFHVHDIFTEEEFQCFDAWCHTWFEKQKQKPKKVSIWKHWKNGIAGNGEGEQIYLIKTGNTYNLSSVLSFECDYIELSELDNLLLEKQGEKATHIDGEDCGIDGLYHAIKILERTVGRVTGYQSDDGILSHEAAIDAVKELYKKQGGQEHFYDFNANDWYVSKVDGKIHNMTYNPTDKVKPEFKVGDCVVNNNSGSVCQVTKIRDDKYCLWPIYSEIQGYLRIIDVDTDYHLWTIADANEGEVLVCDINKAEIGGDVEKLPNITPTIFIYQNVVKDSDYIHSYCSLYDENSLVLQNTMYYNAFVYNIQPATKGQRDLLFQKMKETGYEWDSEKKELKKIEPKKLDVWNAEDEQNLNVVLSFIEDECLRRWLKDKLCYDALDTDKVIEWLDEHVPTKFEDMQNYVNQFKKDFGLC